MKIAFTTKGTGWDAAMEPRFGRTDFLLIFDEEAGELLTVDNSDVTVEAHGAGPKTAQKLFENGVDVLVTGNGPGGNAATVLNEAGVKIYTGAGQTTAKGAYDMYKNNKLARF